MPKIITASQLVAYFQRAVAEGWGYVWSLNGTLYTQTLAQKYHDIQRPTSKSRNATTYWLKDCAKWIGKMAADCSGGIVGAHRTSNPNYSDRTANTFFNQCTETGTIKTLPEVPGLCLWKPGHIEIYEGNGYAIGFRGTDYGATRSRVSSRDFTHWGRLRDVDYSNTDAPSVPVEAAPLVLSMKAPLSRVRVSRSSRRPLIKAAIPAAQRTEFVAQRLLLRRRPSRRPTYPFQYPPPRPSCPTPSP